MVIDGFARKMSRASELDTDTMNRSVSKIFEGALEYNYVKSVFEAGKDEDVFSSEYFQKLSDNKMLATELKLQMKMLRKIIQQFGKVNRLAAKTFQKMLERTIAEYHQWRKHLYAQKPAKYKKLRLKILLLQQHYKLYGFFNKRMK